MDKNYYARIHWWIRKNYGTANHCENPDCQHTSKYFDWALLKGKEYEPKRENFYQLCRRCHLIYDKSGYLGVDTKGKVWTEEQKKRLSLAMKGKLIGKTLSSETKKKISESTKKRMQDPLIKEKIKSAVHPKWTDEQRQRHSEIFKNRIFSEEWKQKLSDSAKKRYKK